MIIDCISDLHGNYPKLEGGDLLIIAGDLTARDTPDQHEDFCDWLDAQPYAKKVVIAGNHDDNILPEAIHCLMGCHYLCDSGTEFEFDEPVPNLFNTDDKSFIFKRKFKIWGSPWTLTFPGMNPHCKAFTVDTEQELADKFAYIPYALDILVTHSPPYGFFDKIWKETKWGNGWEYTGSEVLRAAVMDRINPDLHVFGHIHEWGGRMVDTSMCKFVNASIVDENYEPVNKPVRVIL